MKFIIVYDNEVYQKDIDLKSDWGFSCLIETEYETILFDTGAKGDVLLSNMEKLDVDIRNISKIVISHEHSDHNGGLKSLAAIIDNVELYRLIKQSPSENMHLVSAEYSRQIAEGVFTTGRLTGSVDEQSLVLKGKKGWYVLVGCSHPGVEKILQAAQHIGDIIGIVGGFHGFNSFSVLEQLHCICPCHCTEYKREIKKYYPKAFTSCGVGQLIEI
jgi:7,8-dihydropterin-6-yl-methyl-4-(beta-D-ribofuranosyl)aminobenzene 5'-phosphate synthase